MAGMAAGGVRRGYLVINEDTIWDGSPYGTITDENWKHEITNIDDTAKATTISTKIRQAALQTVGNFTVVQMRTVRLPQ